MILRSIVMPLAGTYVLFLTMLVVTERPGRKSRTVRGSGSGGLPPAAGEPPGFGTLMRYLLVTIACGYATFLVSVGGYYFLVARQTHRFLEQALSGGAFLAFAVTLPAFALFGWLESVRGPSARPGPRDARPPS